MNSIGDGLLVETRIEDGKLLYERRWYHRGQAIYVEGKDMAKFPASISSIGNESVSIFEIKLIQLITIKVVYLF